MEANHLQKPLKRALRSCRRQSKSEHVTKKKKSLDGFALLPDDVLLEILKKLPPDLLRYKVKFVCRRWFFLITDNILFDHASLILQTSTGSNTIRLMDIREEEQGLKMKQQFIKIPFHGCIKSWCNEYLLLTDSIRIGILYLFNLITKQGSFISSPSVSCGGHYNCKCGLGMSYDPFKKVYKVVHVYMGPPIQCEILVLESNIPSNAWIIWKKVNGTSYTGQRQYYWENPVSVQGRYFHWDVHSDKYLVSMDTVKERFRQTFLPGSDVYPMDNRYSLVEMGGFLTLLHKVSFDRVNVWMLKGFQKTKWERFHSICILGYVCLRVFPGSVVSFPVTSVKSKRYIIFRKPGSNTGLYSYDLKNKIMKRLEIDIADNERCVVQSTTSSFWKT
ncbi:uncharacterized protein LOC111905698 [Lactuca sativa]|uniref:uncharacterized protein LOC111905698 n=1 Tax=Lactuca sativa TaxID=4236 RepID=UPI000CD9E9E4|nr:uncharacterized protein LOC111905698 [Lactuca sativa]